MITLDKLISRLQKLRDLHGSGDITVTIPVEENEDVITFEPVLEDCTIDIWEIESDGNTYTGVYIDIFDLLTEDSSL